MEGNRFRWIRLILGSDWFWRFFLWIGDSGKKERENSFCDFRPERGKEIYLRHNWV